MQKLGINHGAYHGETIDILDVLRKVETAASRLGWTSEVIHEQGHFKWLALNRPPVLIPSPQSAIRIYLSAGIHGDEPAGPLAALQLIEENNWPPNAEIVLLPCLNPIGFTLNWRENPEGIDLNRDYRQPKAAETNAHIAWLERQNPFDVYLCLHEDWESHGFYLYEQNLDNQPSLARIMIDAVQSVCPVDVSEIIEGRPARQGIIQPKLNPATRPDWPEALYLISHKARQGYTLEAPSDFPLATRVAALVQAVKAGLAFRAQN